MYTRNCNLPHIFDENVREREVNLETGTYVIKICIKTLDHGNLVERLSLA